MMPFLIRILKNVLIIEVSYANDYNATKNGKKTETSFVYNSQQILRNICNFVIGFTFH